MARRSQCSSAGDNPLDPNYLPPHYREEYRLAIDALVEEDLEGYYQFLQKADVVDFLSTPEIQYIQACVQVPLQSSVHPEQHFLEPGGGDGSSDTYWPVHSDLDAPGLDLGWPQIHPFIGPTEVTTLVNPPEPDMPSIKEQARRLIKNAQQVIGVVMDMFTDIDIFMDILNAAMRNVAVYIILDEQNVDHFVNMVSNCRVNLQSIPFLRVRTVSGITYQCRSGKSFKGQMMDRFLLTDCRAVLSGNYSFMWSFEKLHRCMAHLFLGQLVSTFDEEFRILYAQSQPLLTENVEDFNILQKRQYPSERPSLFRDSRKFLSLDTGHPDEWARHSPDERVDSDWRMMHLKRQESLRGPADLYSSRFPSQQARMDPPFDQGPSRIAMLENPAFKRHSYAEGIHGRYSFPFLQPQGIPADSETQGRHFHRGQGPYPGPESEYTAYDKFWNQDYLSTDQYSEPSAPPEMHPGENFDPVLNYLSSSRNRDFDQSSEKLLPGADLPFGSSHPRRLSLGQTYACQTSPTPSNTADPKQFFQEPTIERKDPMVKRGLRNWRISSFLSAHDNPADEGLPLAPPQAPDPFEEPSNPIEPAPKIPNVREFKVPAVPRASQIPGYIKTTMREQPKKLPDEAATETKTTPSPSPTPSSSSTTEGDKMEEVEVKEPKPIGLRREDSFRRKYNAAMPRSSRLRSSLIFSSMDQQQDPKTSEQDEESDKTEAEPTKLPFVSQVLGQRRSATREPFEWSRYIKSNTSDNSAAESTKPEEGGTKGDEKESTKEDKNVPEIQLPHPDEDNLSPSVPLSSKPFEPELPDLQVHPAPSKPLLSTSSYVDMNDPDQRLMFFKELAAKRKAETEKSKGRGPVKPAPDLQDKTGLQKEENTAKEHKDGSGGTVPGGPESDSSEKDPTTSESCQKDQKVSADLESEALPVSAGPAPQSEPPGPTVTDPQVSSHPPTTMNTGPDSVSYPEDGGLHLDSTSEPPVCETSGSLETPEAKTSPEPEPASIQTSDSSLPDSGATSSDIILGDSSLADKTEEQESITSFTQELTAEEKSETLSSPLDSVSTLTSSVIPSVIVHVESDISPDVCAAGSETDLPPLDSTAQTDSEESETDVCVAGKDASELEICTFPEQSDGLGSSQDDVKLDSVGESGLESSGSKPDLTETLTPPEHHPPLETSSHVNPQSETTTHAPPPLDLNLSVSDPASPVETLSSPPLTDTAGSGLSPKGKKLQTNMSEAPPRPSSPPDAPVESDPPSHTPESGVPESPASEKIPDLTEDTCGTQESASDEKPNDQVKQSNDPAEVTSKQPKSRYHSSTANVLSSSNLRDDTKLLLEQISANSQNRSETTTTTTKESPVTDDEKEDEADKTAKREKERGFRLFSRGQHKSPEEREKLLERIQSMRKDRKVYSRFEMAP